MKKMKKLAISFIAIGFIAINAVPANAVNATPLVTHHYTCPNGGISDGQGNCNVAGTPAVTQESYNASVQTVGTCSTQWANDTWWNRSPYNATVTSTGCHYWSPYYGWLSYDVGFYSTESVYTCPNGGTSDGNGLCITREAVPAVSATSYTATDNPTTSYSCANNYTQVGQECLTAIDAQSASILSPITQIKSFVTTHLLPAILVFVLISIAITLGVGAIRKYSRGLKG